MGASVKWISAGILSASLCWPALLAADEVYRWIDEAGRVHYGATLPPEFAHLPHEVLNSSGLVIRRVEGAEAQAEAARVAAERVARDKRVRADRLLLLKYDSEQDIFDERDSELANLQRDEDLLGRSQVSLMNSMSSQIREAADRQRAGLEPDPSEIEEVAALRQRLVANEASIAQLGEREAAIRDAYDVELNRFRYLSAGGRQGEEPPGN